MSTSGPRLAQLQDRVSELEQTLDAIRAGEVDALVVAIDGEERLFTLRGAETPYRVLVEQMSEGALTLDGQGTILYANLRFAEMIQVPLERVTGSSLASFVAQDDVETLRHLLSKGRPGARELSLKSGAGVLSAYVSVSPLPDAGAATCVLVTDLTAQKQIEFVAAAVRKQQFMRVLNEVSSEEINSPNLAGALLRAIGEHFGASRCVLATVEADGTHWTCESEYAHSVPPICGRHELRTVGSDSVSAQLRAGRVIAVPDVGADPELAGSRDALAAFQMRSLVYVPRLPDGNPVAFLILSHAVARAWTTEDVALLEQAAERVWAALRTAQSADDLRRRENRYRSLVDATSTIVWTTNAEGAFVEPQPSWESYTGHPFDVHRDFGWLEAIHPNDRQRVRQLWGAACDSGQVYRSEGRLWHSESGSYRHFVARAAPLLEADGRVSEWVGTCNDVEEQHVAAEALRIAQQELLHSERVARTESERANRLKDEFLATLSHELRTPLNAILGWASLVVGAAQRGEDVTRGLKTIQRNAKAQAQMIEDLLDMSRITTGKVQLDVQVVDFVSVVEAAIESVLPAADAKGVRILPPLDSCAVHVRGDPGRLRQVVWNLLTNAVKFTPKGGCVQVWLECIDSHASLTVSDTGQGIAPQFLPFVFDRFRQEDSSTTRRHGGLGLGLAIVRTLVELHGGTVRVQSAGENQGATFVVDFPLSLDRDGLVPAPAPALSVWAHQIGTGEGRLWLHGVKVVFVDDDSDSRELVKRVLSEYGADVWTAGSSDEGRSVFSEVRPDVLVSDIGMPREDGYELIRAIRALPDDQGGRTPAAAVTALSRVEDRKRALLAGFHTHVAKPVEPAELVAVVASLAGRTGRA
jgi:PAS domain S-box-containing protein